MTEATTTAERYGLGPEWRMNIYGALARTRALDLLSPRRRWCSSDFASHALCTDLNSVLNRGSSVCECVILSTKLKFLESVP